jgi:hypothetical protein
MFFLLSCLLRRFNAPMMMPAAAAAALTQG